MTKDEMVGWHHLSDGHEFGKCLGAGDGQESLACCSPWNCKESDKTPCMYGVCAVQISVPQSCLTLQPQGL